MTNIEMMLKAWNPAPPEAFTQPERNPMPTEYTVSVSCNFDADSPEDAVRQMTAWLDEAAYHAGYRVVGTDGSSRFLDADRL